MPDTMTSWRSAVRRLAAGRGLSVAGREAAAVALAVLVWQRTGSSAWVGAVLLASELGYIAATPLAGWLADRRDRRRVMVGAELCTAAISAAFVLPLPLPALVALVGLASLSEAPFAAASRAALPTLVPADRLDGANASLTRWRTLGFLAGPIVGGAGAAVAGAELVFLFNSVSSLVCAALVVRLACPAVAAAAGDDVGACTACWPACERSAATLRCDASAAPGCSRGWAARSR